jgi:ATP-dependent DNA helicase RecG
VDAQALISEDPSLAGYPGLAAMVANLVPEDRAEYLDKS